LAYLLAVLGCVAICVVLAIVVRLSKQSRLAASQLSTHRIRAGDRCPSCHVGTVQALFGPTGTFLGCSNHEFGVCNAAWTLKGVRITQPQGHRQNDRLPPG
jgi:hypothetical protein